MTLIDGYNLLMKCAPLRRLVESEPAKGIERARGLLLSRLAFSREAELARATVIFDGSRVGAYVPPHGLSRGNVRAHFSEPGTSADDLILTYVRAAEEPRAIRVVTSDRELAGHARTLGARALESEAVADRLFPPGEPVRHKPARGPGESDSALRRAPKRDDEVGAWLDYFGFEGEERK